MASLDTLTHAATRASRVVVLSEGTDPRAIEAAKTACDQGLARIVLVGSEAEIRAGLGPARPEGLSILDPATTPLHTAMAARYHELRGHKGVTREAAEAAVRNPHVAAALLVRMGFAHGTLGGAVATTAEIVRTALQVIGKEPGEPIVSSFFLMELKDGVVVFSDAGLVIDPSAEELAAIAAQAAGSFRRLMEEEPRVAMLSFSTKGSARHGHADKVIEAARLLTEMHPELAVDGELQFDAAYVPEVAEKKAPGSRVAGRANVFIFPDLNSGNIAYKVAQRVGGATAIGPILQGLSKPANDLSRGCTAEDIVHMIAVTAAQASADPVIATPDGALIQP